MIFSACFLELIFVGREPCCTALLRFFVIDYCQIKLCNVLESLFINLGPSEYKHLWIFWILFKLYTLCLIKPLGSGVKNFYYFIFITRRNVWDIFLVSRYDNANSSTKRFINRIVRLSAHQQSVPHS